MDYIKLIDLYLEGELNQVEKDLLFAELSRNPELREYFDQQMQFNQLFQKDMQSIAPPLDATNYIFSSLDFKIPNSAYPRTSPAPLGLLYNFKQIVAKYFPFVASSIFGGLVSFVLLWIFIPWQQTAEPVQQGIQVVSQPGIPVGSAVEVPKIVATENKTYTMPVANLERAFQSAFEKWLRQFNLQANNLPSDNSISSNATEPSRTFEPVTTSRNTLNQLPIAFNKIFVQDGKIKSNIPINQNFEVPVNHIEPILNHLSKFTLTFRGYMLNSQPEVNINTTQTSLLNNAGIGIGYELGKNSTIGFEFGQEKFPQRFTLIRDDDKMFYKQNPLLWWYGLYYQQAVSNLFSFEWLKPFAKIFVGGTPVGPLARGTIGLQYTPDRRVSLFLGWEGTILWYKVQNNLYQTRKNGITYGVSVKY